MEASQCKFPEGAEAIVADINAMGYQIIALPIESIALRWGFVREGFLVDTAELPARTSSDVPLAQRIIKMFADKAAELTAKHAKIAS